MSKSKSFSKHTVNTESKPCVRRILWHLLCQIISEQLWSYSLNVHHVVKHIVEGFANRMVHWMFTLHSTFAACSPQGPWLVRVHIHGRAWTGAIDRLLFALTKDYILIQIHKMCSWVRAKFLNSRLACAKVTQVACMETLQAVSGMPSEPMTFICIMHVQIRLEIELLTYKYIILCN